MRSWLLILSVIAVPALTSAQSATLAVAKENAPVYVRPGPPAGAVPLRVAAAGTRFRVLSEAEAGWVQVQFADPQFGTRIGWVSAHVVTLIRPDLQPMDLSGPSPGAPKPPSGMVGETRPLETPSRPSAVSATLERRVPTATAASRPPTEGRWRNYKLRGYVTNVSSPTEFDIEDYRITRDQQFALEFDNDDGQLQFRAEDIRIGVEVEIKGQLNEDTGQLRAQSIRVDLEQFKKSKHTAVISYPPSGVTRSAAGWSGRFVVDGQRVEVTPRTRVLFKHTSVEKKLAKAAKRSNDGQAEDESDFVVLQSLEQVTAGMLMSYEGPRSPDGTIQAERVTFIRNDLEKGEEKLWKTLTPEVKAFDGSKPPELKINRVGKFKLVPDEGVQTYVARIGQSLIPAHQRNLDRNDPGKLNFRFFVVNEKEPNAFALANGTVVVHAGMFAVLENEAQLAAVVGHEIAHATQEHTWRQMQFHKKKQFALAIGAAIASAYGQYALSDVLNLTQAAIQSGYSRSLENQADRVGLEYLVSAGYDPRSAPQVWKNMTKAYGLQVTNFFWSSHDNQATRRSYLMNELKNNYSDLDYRALKTEPDEFVRMRSRVLAAVDGKIRLRVTGN